MIQTAILTKDGLLMVPAETLKEMGLEEDTTMEIVVDRGNNVIILRPALDEENDAWAYTPEHIALVKQALADPRSHALTRTDLARLAGLPEGEA